jgi:hypothetical protein
MFQYTGTWAKLIVANVTPVPDKSSSRQRVSVVGCVVQQTDERTALNAAFIERSKLKRSDTSVGWS